MLNVQQLTARLATLPDQALQQYAQMHKEDPYTLALAVSESNRRKALRGSGQPDQAAMQQPPVADQAIAEMGPQPPQMPPMQMQPGMQPQMPPDAAMQGIAAGVPAQAMQMAEGGIVGYEAGGTTRGPTPGRTSGQRAFNEAWERLRGARADALPPVMLQQAAQQFGGDVGDALSEISPPKAIPYSPGYQALRDADEAARAARRRGQPTAPASAAPSATSFPLAGWGSGRGSAAGPTADQLAAAHASNFGISPQQPAQPPAQPPAELQGIGAVMAGASGGAGAAGGAGGINYNPDAEMAAIRKLVEGYTGAQRTAAQEDADAYDKLVADAGQLGEGREKRAKDRLAELDSKKDKAKASALVQAGFAILAADPSKGGWAAIGEGGGKGLAQYRGDVAEIEATRSALLDNLDNIEDLRRQETLATGKEKLALRRAIRQAEVEGQKIMVDVGTKMGMEVKPAIARATYEQTQANWRAQLSANTTLAAAQERGGARGQEILLPGSEKYVQRQTEIVKALKDMPQNFGKSPQELFRMAEQEIARHNSLLQGAPSGPSIDLKGWGAPKQVN
jgi:hypothetical protein